MPVATNKWAATVDRWVSSPLAFVREIFGIEPDEWQKEALEAFPHNQYLALQACKGPGKLQPLRVVIDTPAGPRKWGDLQVGDMLFAEDGSPTRIVARHDHKQKKIYRVTFDDGSSTLAGGEHLWKCAGRTERRKGLGWSVLTTEEIIARGVTIPNGRWAQKQFVIPRQGAAQFPRADQEVDAYVLGVWLGDGSANTGDYTKPYVEVEHEINRRGYSTTRGSDGKHVKVHGLRPQLKSVGCLEWRSWEKSIPPKFKYASIEQRRDLLCGLMDTDGSIGKDGHMEYSSTSEGLAQDVVWLVRSLGGVALIKEAIKEGWYRDEAGERIECRDCWRVTVVTDFNPFRIGHKAERWRNPMRSKSTERYLTRFISSIEEEGIEDAMCVEVDHPSHCYLTNDFIVTHNTAVLAWLCWNFLVTRPFANIGATSVSGDNLRDNLWKEMLKAMDLNKNGFLKSQFEWTSTKIFRKGHQGRWFMVARTWPKQGNPSSQATTLAGLHEDNIMFVLDESGGIPESVMVTAEAAMSSCVEGHILQAGNPEVTDGPLYRAAKNRKNGPTPVGTQQWYVIEITADPDDPMRTPRVDIEYARQQIRNWGRTNPWVMINVLGKFPNGSVSSLISEEEVRAAMQRYYRPYEIGLAARIMGVDVARQGLAMSVISKREGIQMHNFLRYRNLDNNQGGSLTNRIWTEWEADACFIDATGGFGFGWIDNLKLLGKSAIPVQFASNAIQNPERYVNKRAEMYFTFVQWIRDGGALPPEDSEGARELLEALTKTQYFHSRDRLQLEEKEQLTERIGFSPDEADAGALTFAEPVTAKKRTVGRPNQSAVGSYQPFADMDRNRGGGYGQPGNAGGMYDPFKH